MKTAASSVISVVQLALLWLLADTRRITTIILLGLVMSALLASFYLMPAGHAFAMPMASSGGP